MTSPTMAERYSSSCARMLCAVAVASLSTTSLLRTKSANPSVVEIQAKIPAILAWKRGDASPIHSILKAVRILVSDHKHESYVAPIVDGDLRDFFGSVEHEKL